VSNELLDSSNFDVSSWLQGEVERNFANTLETEIATGAGDGSNQCLGIITQSTSTANDTDSPERAFNLYQRMNVGVNSPISSFSYFSLTQLVQKLPVRYRRNAKWYGSSTGIQTMRDLADGQARPIWVDAQGGVSGAPQNILGYQVEESSALASVAFGNIPVLFGDLQQAYIFASHSRGIRVIRDDVTSPGNTLFYVSLQCGGQPADTRALKALRVA
jgi:HK97 family phage major capsid protein